MTLDLKPPEDNSDLNRRVVREDMYELLGDLIKLTNLEAAAGDSVRLTDKDDRARRAIEVAGELIGPLIAWALHHEVGKVLAGEGSYVSHANHRSVTRKLANYTEQKNLALNSHENEVRGMRYDGGDPIVNRTVVAKFLYLLSREMKFLPGQKIAVSLGQLNNGYVDPGLKPAKTNRKFRPAELDQFRLQAVLHVEFRRGTGKTLQAALTDVSSHYGVRFDALQAWMKSSQKRLPTIDYGSFVDRCAYVRELGKRYAALTDEAKRAKLPPSVRANFDQEENLSRIRREARDYSDQALVADGERYKSTLKAAKSPSR